MVLVFTSMTRKPAPEFILPHRTQVIYAIAEIFYIGPTLEHSGQGQGQTWHMILTRHRLRRLKTPGT